MKKSVIILQVSMKFLIESLRTSLDFSVSFVSDYNYNEYETNTIPNQKQI